MPRRRGVEQAMAGVSSAHADQRRVAMRSADAQAKLAKVDQARAALDAALLNFELLQHRRALDGVATHKQVEPGQIVQPGQGLLVVVPLRDVWVTANFKETQLKNMKPGQKAYLKVDTYGKTFTGHVDSIAGATGAVLSFAPPKTPSGNYVKVVQRVPVKIVLDPNPAGSGCPPAGHECGSNGNYRLNATGRVTSDAGENHIEVAHAGWLDQPLGDRRYRHPGLLSRRYRGGYLCTEAATSL